MLPTTCGLKLTCAFAPNPKTSAHRPSQDNIGAVLATPPAEWCCTAEGHCTKWASADAISLASVVVVIVSVSQIVPLTASEVEVARS